MKKRIFILVFAAAALVSCVNDPHGNNESHGNFNRDVFNRERQLWLEQGIQNYSFYLNEGNTSTGLASAFMYIQDGVLVYIQLSKDDVPMPVEEKLFLPFSGKTISDVYAKIEAMISSADRRDTVEIQYDSEWHYPNYFSRRMASGHSSYIKIGKFSVGTEMPSPLFSKQ
jgi:hypothetical protein